MSHCVTLFRHQLARFNLPFVRGVLLRLTAPRLFVVQTFHSNLLIKALIMHLFQYYIMGAVSHCENEDQYRIPVLSALELERSCSQKTCGRFIDSQGTAKVSLLCTKASLHEEV
jgi:hypothetical protein